MDLRTLTRTVQEQLAASAAIGDDGTRRAAHLLSVSLEPALRLALQDAVSQVAADVSAGIAPGRVEVTLRGEQLEVDVVPPAMPPPPPAPPAPPAPVTDDPSGDPGADGGAARVTFRPPQQLKARLEDAAAQQQLSLNAFLIRALTSHLDGADRASDPSSPYSRTGRTSGWFL